MSSVRRHEGYLLLDHRATAPVPEELTRAAGLPPSAGRGLFEAPTFTCSHCNSVVIINPDRKRARYHCRGCDHLLCDNCAAARAAGASCKTFKQIVDEACELASRGINPSSLIISK